MTEEKKFMSFVQDDYEYQEDVPLQNVMNFIYDWYEGILPRRLDSQQFVNFAVRSKELAQKIAPGVPMHLDNSTSAYTDGKTLYLPIIYLVPGFYRTIGIPQYDEVAAAIAAINGSQCHEALHIFFKIADWKWVVNEFLTKSETTYLSATGYNESEIKELREYFVSKNLTKVKGFYACANLIADLAIEAGCTVKFPSLYNFIYSKNELLLGPRLVKSAVDELEKKTNVDSIMEALFFAKSVNAIDELIEQFPIIEPFVKTVERARKAEAANGFDVVLVATDLLRQLMNDTDSSDSQFAETMPDDSGRQPDLKPGSIEAAIAKAIAAAFDSGEMDYDGEKADGDKKTQSITRQIIEEIIEQFKEEQEAIEIEEAQQHNVSIRKLSEISKSIHEIHFVDILEWSALHKLSHGRLKDVSKWKQFGSYLKYARHETKSTGVPKDKGRKLIKHRLARITTDGKAFVTPNNTQIRRGKPEVVILLDVSGSMRHNDIYDASGSMSLMEAVANAGYGMHLSLMNAGIANTVVAHTSSSHVPGGGYCSPIMYGIAAYEMPYFGSSLRTTGNSQERFETLLGVSCEENFDGIAVSKCAELFSSSKSTKVLLVLSDGQPSASGYSGRDAIDHTRKSAIALRNLGINVISMSLTSGVMDTNNRIYGEENNIAAYGENFQKATHSIVEKIALTNKT